MTENKRITNLIKQRIELLNNFDDIYPNNPDDLISNGISEYGKSSYDLYSEIARDSKVSGVEKIIRRTIFSADWDISYTNEDDKNDDIIEFIRENLKNIENDDFTNILKNLMDARIYGFKVAEKVFKYENNKMMLKYIKCFDSSYFDFQTDRYQNLIGVKLFSGDTKTDDISIDDFQEKFIHFVYPYIKDGNYYGTSAYYPLYETWRRKQRLNIITPIAFELRGIPPIKNIYDQSANKDVKDSISSALKNLKNASRLNIPSKRNSDNKLEPLFDVEFMQGGTIDFNAFIKQIDEYDKDMSRTLGLPDDLGYTSTEHGSNAKAKTQLRVFYDMILDEQRKLERLVTKQIVKQLVNLNFGEQEVYPEFNFVREDFDTMAMKIALIKELKSSGVPVTDDYIQKFLNIPIKEETEIIEQPKKPILEVEKEVPKEFAKKSDFITGIHTLNINLARNDIINRADYSKIDDFYSKIETGYKVRLVREINKARYDILKTARKIDKEIEFPKKYKDNASKYVYALSVRSYLDGKLKSIEELKRKGIKAFDRERQYVADWIMNEHEQYKKDELLNIQDVLQEYLDRGVTLSKGERQEIRNIKNFASIWGKKLSNDIADKINLMKLTINPDTMTYVQIADKINEVFSKYTALIEKNDVDKFIPVNELKLPYITTVVRTNSAAYFNRGRYKAQTDPDVAEVVQALRYSAILDTRTTWFCEQHHNETLKIGDPQINIIYPPNHYNCRSLFVPVFYDDDYKVDWGNKSMQTQGMQEAYSSPAENFGGRGVVDIPISQKELEKAV